MIYFDASVAVKWFKKGERHEKEAMNLLTKVIALDIDAASSEWTSIEIVRGLKRAQNKGEMYLLNNPPCPMGTPKPMKMGGGLFSCQSGVTRPTPIPNPLKNMKSSGGIFGFAPIY